MWSNIKTAVEEHVSSENISTSYTFWWSMIIDHNEYVPTVIKETWSRQTNKQAKVIQEVVSAEVS